MATYSIVIPTWNGLALLKKNLPQLIAATGPETEVIVVDNGSTDKTVEWVEGAALSRVRLVRLSRNFGFASACQVGIDQSSAPLVVLLNNDVVPEKGFLIPVRPLFDDERVFAVSFHEPQFGPATGDFSTGFLHHAPGPKSKTKKPSLWASGGSAVFRKEYWRELGGFDPLYRPFYWEDVDIGYRAWKHGWKIWWEPRAVVHHRHEGTMSRLPKNYVARIQQRNHLLFIWKNIHDSRLFGRHLRALWGRLIAHPGYGLIVLSALGKLPAVITARRWAKREAVRTDGDVFASFERREG